MHSRNAIEEVFGAQACGHALFYEYPGGLRFELSEGESPLDQVLTALRKATIICDDLFDRVDSFVVCLRKYSRTNRYAFRSTLKELELAGISIPRSRSIWLETAPRDDWFDENVEERWVSVAFELSKTKLQNLLWCAFSGDFGPIRPNPHCLIYLFNFAERVMVHPYDDRGMDVVGSNEEVLRGLYLKHNDFLLDYDRGTMDATFCSP